jgi:hypothetical protein
MPTPTRRQHRPVATASPKSHRYWRHQREAAMRPSPAVGNKQHLLPKQKGVTDQQNAAVQLATKTC